jgi:hypothetical protein
MKFIFKENSMAYGFWTDMVRNNYLPNFNNQANQIGNFDPNFNPAFFQGDVGPLGPDALNQGQDLNQNLDFFQQGDPGQAGPNLSYQNQNLGQNFNRYNSEREMSRNFGWQSWNRRNDGSENFGQRPERVRRFDFDEESRGHEFREHQRQFFGYRQQQYLRPSVLCSYQGFIGSPHIRGGRWYS